MGEFELCQGEWADPWPLAGRRGESRRVAHQGDQAKPERQRQGPRECVAVGVHAGAAVVADACACAGEQFDHGQRRREDFAKVRQCRLRDRVVGAQRGAERIAEVRHRFV